ncbi:CvpA family protein [Candidatus Cytomitobacter primus]|uniref:CvpA family protein n=1 Tax=Candidatus Cytomitobacter primus TaxID=2066024 RepID=A0A5C0UFM5_9PROT|nr:CvpA family protein [Candidatus Cytomitobacter primus]QEK38443.1 CvpA family protein [Candidatus Cytomitobacter primus]
MYYKSFDFIVLVATSYFVVSGLIRGFFGEITKILSIGISIAVSVFAMLKFCMLGNKLGSVAYYSSVFGVPIIIFLIVGYILLGISSKLSNMIGKSHFRSLDRFLGIILGLIKIFILVVLFIKISDEFYPDFTQYIEKSIVYKWVSSSHVIAKYINNMLMNAYDFIGTCFDKLICCFTKQN